MRFCSFIPYLLSWRIFSFFPSPSWLKQGLLNLSRPKHLFRYVFWVSCRNLAWGTWPKLWFLICAIHTWEWWAVSGFMVTTRDSLWRLFYCCWLKLTTKTTKWNLKLRLCWMFSRLFPINTYWKSCRLSFLSKKPAITRED